MSDGGRESRGDSARDASNGSREDEDFGRAVAKIAVAQICEKAGFQSYKESALEDLAEIAIRYVSDLGRTANFYSNLAGRTECNAFDVVQGLEDLGSPLGFSGTSKSSRCLASSGVMRELNEYVKSAEEIPFAQPVPLFPVPKNRRLIPSFLKMGEMPMGKHVPAWLPALPDPHTYVHTPVWNERKTDPRAEKTEQARQRRKAERSLLSLQQRLAYNSAAASLASAERGDGATALRVAESNPFLAAGCSAPAERGDEAGASSSAAVGNPFLAIPLQPEEKDVSPVVLPAKLANEAVVENHVSVLEAFAPAIHEVQGGFVVPRNGERNSLPDKRPSVHFKLRTAKKFLCKPLDASLKDRAAGRAVSFIACNDEKDDKKRRAELILRQSMENPQELAQL